MKSEMKNIFIPVLTAFVLSVAGCGWTEPENLDYTRKPFEEVDPAGYEAYLQGVREYKKTDHKLMILTMKGTSEYPVLQSQRIMAMPDSADFICVTDLEDLHPEVVKEISLVEEKKGTAVVSYVDMATAYSDWNDYKISLLDQGETEEAVMAKAPAFFREHAQKQLSYCDRYGFKGILLSVYISAGLTVEEIEKCLNPFADAAGEWKKSHPDHLFSIRGTFQNIADKTILDESDWLIIVFGKQQGVNGMKEEIRGKFRAYPETDPVRKKTVFELTVPSLENPEQVGDSPYDAAGHIFHKDLENEEGYRGCKIIGLSVENAHDDYYNEKYYADDDTERENPIYFGTNVNVRRAITRMNQTEIQ